MGASSSSRSPRPSRSDSTNRMSVLGPRPPKPDPEELERRFTYVLASMDLPPDKARVLRSYDDDRKWDIICDQERFSAKESPQSYLNKIRLYLDPLDPKNAKNLKNLGLKNIGQTSSTKTLKELEISLRTNHIEWVQEFLSEENNGLDVLVDYLSLTQEHMRLEQEEGAISELDGANKAASERNLTLRANTIPKRYSTVPRRISTAKVHFGQAPDDVHICIMCLRAIMNHQNGFNLIFGHKQAINCIALSLNHRNFRTKTLVLELLAAICLVSGGHEMIMSAFDNFKNVCGETHRFETLVRYFRNFEDFHIDFMVACMQFINIIVHSVQDMNFRVHLQHEFSLLGLDDILDRLKDTESDKLPVQVNAYLENMVDVQSLLEDSDLKTLMQAQVEELSTDLSIANERLQEVEDQYLEKIAQLQEKLSTVTEDRDLLQVVCEALKADVQNHKDGKISLETSAALQRVSSHDPSTQSESVIPIAPPFRIPTPPVLIPMCGGPPPPPPLPGPGGGPPPPPPPPGPGGAPALVIKKKIQPKYRLPILNWVAMKPQEAKGTMFSEIDDEKLYKVIDFNQFEECFKIGNLSLDEPDGGTIRNPAKRPEKTTTSLLESNRVRNIAITRRKIEKSDAEIAKAINSFDLTTLRLEWVEILLRIAPNDQEIKLLKEYEKDRKPIDQLADEDKFMLSLMKVERHGTKLQIMSFIGNFTETYHHLCPQLNAVYAASKSIRSSAKIRQLFEIILAFGNYMNSSKRGAVYGFKLQSLDMLLETKTSDKKMSLLHFIVKTVREKFPSIANFEVDLDYIEKASTVSLDNILTDISEQEKGMELTRKEYEARKERDAPVVLKDFLNNSEEKLKKLNHDAKNAREAYSKLVEYFGENPKMIAPNTFFSLFVRFGRAFKQAETDLETMARLEEALLQKANVTKQKRQTVKQTQEAVVNELRGKQRQVLNRDEIAHGTLDDLINDIKKNPYRRTDAMRRSFRRNAADVNCHQLTTSCPC